jgi:hypothetical protein
MNHKNHKLATIYVPIFKTVHPRCVLSAIEGMAYNCLFTAQNSWFLV